MNESFLAFVESEGWPGEADSTVDRRLHHDSAEDFWSNFTHKNGVPSLDKNLNNFRVWLATEPVIIPEGNTLADLMSDKDRRSYAQRNGSVVWTQSCAAPRVCNRGRFDGEFANILFQAEDYAVDRKSVV